MNILRLLCLAIMAFISINAIGQDLKANQVPQVVRDGFKAIYPDAYVYEWEWSKKKGLYEAEFKIKGIAYEAYLTKNGEWIRTEHDIKERDVPPSIWESLSNSEYSTWRVDDIEEHNTPQHAIMYEVEVKNNKRKTLLYFLPDGLLVNKIIVR